MAKTIPSRNSKIKSKRDPFVKVEDSVLLQTREKLHKTRNWRFLIVPELVGTEVEAIYKKGVLVTKEVSGLAPENLFFNFNEPEVPNKNFGGKAPSLLAIRGIITTAAGKKRFIAYDAYELKNDEPSYYMNLNMTRTVMYGKKFDVLPYYLVADANTGTKTEENKLLVELIKKECAKYDWPCKKVSINNTETRAFIIV